MSEETSHMEFASVSPAELSAQDVTFAVNRLTHQQYLDALGNTVIDKAQNTIVSAVNPSFMSLRPNQFYMTVDEDIKGDFQLSDYVSLVDFYQQTSSMLNFRGMTHDEAWTRLFMEETHVQTSPSDLYYYWGYPLTSTYPLTEDAPYLAPKHGDMVFAADTGQEFMYTSVETTAYWSQVGNDWMLSTIRATVSTAVENISGYIEFLSNYASAYLSGQISGLSSDLNSTSSYISGQVHGHIANTSNPHQVTAGQLNVYLCSQTSAASELDAAFSGIDQKFQNYALSADVYSKDDINSSFAKYYLSSQTSSATEINDALLDKVAFADVPEKFMEADVQDVLGWRYDDQSAGGNVTGLVFDGAGAWTMTYVTQSSETLTADCAGSADADELEFSFEDSQEQSYTVDAYKDAVVGKVLTVQSRTVANFAASPSTPPLSVAVEPRLSGESWESSVRSCALVIDCAGTPTPPTVTWPSQFRPKTSGSSDFACAGGKKNYYRISEYADGLFVVEGWQETQNASGFTVNV